MSNTRLEVVKGAMVFRDDTHMKRYVDAFGANVVKYIDDFTHGPAVDAAFDNEWTVTRVEAGAGESTVTRTDGSGGHLLITTDATENDGVNMQQIGEAFELTSDQVLYFGAFGITINDVTQTDLFIGLAITDTDILGGVTDRIGFECLDGSAALGFMVEKDGTETKSSSIATIVDATPFDVEFFYDGGTGELMVFVNGAEVTAPAVTNLPDNEALRLTIQFLTGETGAQTCQIDAIRVIQIGR